MTVQQSPAVAIIEMLTPVWQRVLQLPSVGVNDNFFELGGDSASAVELFNAVAAACGRELPPVTIYQAPTIALLAALLEQSQTPRYPVLTLLKPGVQPPPVFITHGLGGTVIDFYQLVKYVQTSHPIQGMQARGIDGVDKPLDRVEDMADYYLGAVKVLQPRGPYLLVGYSLGGLVVFEMAQRLSAVGEKVALVAMLDAYPHDRHLPLSQRAQITMHRITRGASKLLRRRAKYTAEDTHRTSGNMLSDFAVQRPAGLSLTPTMQRVREADYGAIRRYKPRYYNGKVHFVRAKIMTKFPEDPAAVWGAFVRELEVTTVPGDHLGIITTHFDKLGSALSRLVGEAFRQE